MEPVHVTPEVEAAPLELAELDWEGVTVKLPAELEDLDPDVVEAFENGKAITAIRAIFGSDEYDRARNDFAKRHGRRPTMRDLEPLSDAVAKHFGFESSGE